MTETSSNTAEPSIEKHVFGWLLFIVSLFPLVALLTYDWRSVAALRVPPLPSTNWVGALGDTFAYYGYTVIGLAVWIIPVVCVALGLCLVGGRRLRLGRRIPWFALLLAACACLLQVAQRHAPGISAALDRVNIANAGGVVGYLVMSRLVSPLLSDFGGSAVMAMIALVALVECIGVKAILGFFAGLYRWAAASGTIAPSREAAGSDEEYEAQQAAYLAALQAKKDAKEQARLEKEQARLEKERAKAEKAAARQAEKEAIRAAKEAARAEREAARTAELAGAPAVHVDEHGAGDPPEAEDHAPAGPVRGDVHRPRVPRALDRVDLRAEDVGARRVVDGHAVGRVPPALRPLAGDLEEMGHLRRLRGGRDVLRLVVDLEGPEAVERDPLAARVLLAPRVGHRPHRVAGGEVRNDRFGRREGAAGGQRREEGETGFRFHGDHLMTMTVGGGASSSRR